MNGVHLVKRWIKVAAIAAFVLVGGASALTVSALVPTGQFTTLKPILPVQCTKLPGAVGAEDFAIDWPSGRAYVSSLDRRRLADGDKSVRGELFALDLGAAPEQRTFRPLTAGKPRDFRPHGVSLYRGKDGARRLFAINHRSDGTHSVEIYKVEGDRLVHLKSVRDPGLGSPNDVLAVGPDRFYVTDDGGRGDFARGIDMVFQRKRTGVVYFDGARARDAAKGFVYANGIDQSPDGSTVYVADTSANRLMFFSRDKSSGALREIGRLFLGSSLDNIVVDPEGTLWIGTHPKPIELFRHIKHGRPAPSQVVKATPKPGGGGTVRTVFLDPDGRLISGATVGAAWRGQLLVGPLLDRHMLLCRLDGPGGQ